MRSSSPPLAPAAPAARALLGLLALPALLLLGLLLFCPRAATAQIHVKHDATGLGDGSSWRHAFPALQDALEAARPGDEIWVARGTYRPDEGSKVGRGDRKASFVLRPRVALYGGFRGSELRREDRRWQLHETVLSGDLMQNDGAAVELEEATRRENSFHVVLARGEVDSTAVLDGFTITAGHADSTWVPGVRHTYSDGGGLYNEGSPTIRNVVITRSVARSFGGGLFNVGSPTMQEVVFAGNVAGTGGGMNSGAGEARLTRATFSGNVARTSGGGMFSGYGRVVLREVLFRENVSKTFGGGLYVNRGEAVLVGGRFVENQGGWGGGMYNRQGKQLIVNTAFLGNAARPSDGGALVNDESETELVNVLMSGNTAYGDGGAIYNVFPDAGSFQATHLTVVGNEAGGDGGGLYNFYGRPLVRNSILWGNAASPSTEPGTEEVFNRMVFAGPTILRLSHSIVEGGLPPHTQDEGGNLDGDPRFADALGPDGLPGTDDDDLRLLATSPAIDAGDNAALPPDVLDLDGDGNTTEALPVDLGGHVRLWDGTGDGRAVVDMGAYEFGAPPVSVGLEGPVAGRQAAALLEVYPNPFRERAVVRFGVGRTAAVEVALYDALGRRVGVLYRGVVAAGREEAVVLEGGGLPSGFYVVRLSGGGLRATAALLRLR